MTPTAGMSMRLDAPEGEGQEDPPRGHRHGRRRDRPAERISGGLISCLGWGAVYFVLHWQWAVFPLVFMGLLPLLSGIRGAVSARLEAPARQRVSEDQRRAGIEREILRLARDHAGRVTPALVSIEAGLGLDEAQAALDSLAARGHANLDVLESGRVEYEFPEFTRQELR